jgi:hypothetical protein
MSTLIKMSMIYLCVHGLQYTAHLKHDKDTNTFYAVQLKPLNLFCLNEYFGESFDLKKCVNKER